MVILADSCYGLIHSFQAHSRDGEQNYSLHRKPESKAQEKGLESHYLLQGHTPSDIHPHQTVPLKGATTSQLFSYQHQAFTTWTFLQVALNIQALGHIYVFAFFFLLWYVWVCSCIHVT